MNNEEKKTFENYKIEVNFQTGELEISPMNPDTNKPKISLSLQLTRQDNEKLSKGFSELGSSAEVSATGKLKIENDDLEFFNREVEMFELDRSFGNDK